MPDVGVPKQKLETLVLQNKLSRGCPILNHPTPGYHYHFSLSYLNPCYRQWWFLKHNQNPGNPLRKLCAKAHGSKHLVFSHLLQVYLEQPGIANIPVANANVASSSVPGHRLQWKPRNSLCSISWSVVW